MSESRGGAIIGLHVVAFVMAVLTGLGCWWSGWNPFFAAIGAWVATSLLGCVAIAVAEK